MSAAVIITLAGDAVLAFDYRADVVEHIAITQHGALIARPGLNMRDDHEGSEA